VRQDGVSSPGEGCLSTLARDVPFPAIYWDRSIETGKKFIEKQCEANGTSILTRCFLTSMAISVCMCGASSDRWLPISSI
jgi:hypothetical protein